MFQIADREFRAHEAPLRVRGASRELSLKVCTGIIGPQQRLHRAGLEKHEASYYCVRSVCDISYPEEHRAGGIIHAQRFHLPIRVLSLWPPQALSFRRGCRSIPCDAVRQSRRSWIAEGHALPYHEEGGRLFPARYGSHGAVIHGSCPGRKCLRRMHDAKGGYG